MDSIEKRKPHGNSRLAKIGRPVLCRKKKAGAPKGNKNALRHGVYAAETRARHARYAELRRRANLLVAHIEGLVRERARRAQERDRDSAGAPPAAPPVTSPGAVPPCNHAKVSGAPLLEIGHGANE